MKPVIVAIGYNRKLPLLRLLTSLEEADYGEDEQAVTLIISLDYSGNQNLVEMANDFQWSHGEKKVRTFEVNQGLKKHVMSCIDYSLQYGAVIIFEDDIVASPAYYNYIKQALEYYKNDKRIAEIALYNQTRHDFANREFMPMNNGYDVYATKKNCSWGQCIIGERWREFREWYSEHNGELEYHRDVPAQVLSWKNSWCKYFNYYLDTHDRYVIEPHISLSTNFNDEGTHIMCQDNGFQVPILAGQKKWNFGSLEQLPMYDDYMENVKLKEELSARYGKEVCIDFYGSRGNREEYDLCLSSAILPYHIVEKFGLEMRPYELNVMYNVPGDGIRIYDMRKPCKYKKDWKQHYRYVKYEIKTMPVEEGLFFYLYQKVLRYLKK